MVMRQVTWLNNLYVSKVVFQKRDIVDGRNPAPVEMYKPLKIMGQITYALAQDFFHQP